MSVNTLTPAEVFYPYSDGKPMAESTRQQDWIFKLIGNLRILFRDRDDVFVAGDQFWYPVKDHPEIVQAPDAYVVFGRPKGHRPSYKQWEEGDVPMTVVFEVLSPSNTTSEMADKLEWYSEHRVEEYYVVDPETDRVTAYRRGAVTLVGVDPVHNYASPRLGIRFDLSGPELVVRYPDGRPFVATEELDGQRRDAERRAEDEHKRAEDEHKRAEDEHKRAEGEHKRAEGEHKRANEAIERADRAERRAARLAALTQRVLLQQATPEEQEELRALLAAPQP
jgi:Uma2 family endonuclease